MACYVVTGAAGFIASKVSEQLMDAGHKVIGVDDMNDAYDVRLKDWRLSHLEARPEFSFARLDIRDGGALSDLFQNNFGGGRPPCDGVVNLAARAGVRQSVENPWIYQETNVIGTLNLLELCRDYGVKKFVLASTSSLYGASNPRPFREDADTDGPLSPYAASKKGAEALCYTYHYLYDIDVTVLRYFTVYGPAGRPDMSLFRFVQWIHEGRPVTVFGDGLQERDFTYVDDIARGTVAGLQPLGFEIINLGSDEPVVLNDAIHLIEELADAKAQIESQPRHPADVQATWADISKARKLLGWQPQASFEEGVRQLVEWYRENRGWAKEVATQ
ncbi:MAG TPA: GDP-mannose 4,6-dehydratase [Gemmatimonadota bacterium]|nr:GDP-mannose 4,6-dehydratase [Gemmatimonadota bacterium]